MATVDRTDPNWEEKLSVRNQQIAESVAKPVAKNKVPRESGLPPEWITLREAWEMTGIPKSSFDKRRREGHFKVYLQPGCHTVRLRYDEVLDDAPNLYSGGKPRHEPSKFLPRRGDV